MSDRRPPPEPAGARGGPEDDRDRQDAGLARRGGPGPAIAAATVVLVVLVVALVMVARDGRQAEPSPSPVTASPIASPTPTPDPTPTPSPEPDATPTEAPAPDEPTPTPTAAPAAQERAQMFVHEYAPEGGEQVLSAVADLDGDGNPEVVFAAIVDDSSRIDIARWNGRLYAIDYIDYGSAAQELVGLRVEDFTGNGRLEIVTEQASGREGASLTVWGWDGRQFARQSAVGGCWDGSHTYGIIGARIAGARIEATCDDSPLPTSAWSTDIYVWDGQAWIHDETRFPE